MNKSEFYKRIDAFKASAQSMKGESHELLIIGAKHVCEHGDVTPLKDAFEAVCEAYPKHISQIKQWVREGLPFVVAGKDGWSLKKKEKRQATDAVNTPWFDLTKPEAEKRRLKGDIVRKRIESMIETLESGETLWESQEDYEEAMRALNMIKRALGLKSAEPVTEKPAKAKKPKTSEDIVADLAA